VALLPRTMASGTRMCRFGEAMNAGASSRRSHALEDLGGGRAETAHSLVDVCVLISLRFSHIARQLSRGGGWSL
jgi:hypothetical protein